MPEFNFKVLTIKEVDYDKEKDPYIKELRKASIPLKNAMDALAKEIEELNKASV